MLSSTLLMCLAVAAPSTYPSNTPLPDGTQVLRDVSYVTNGDPAQRLDLYLPKEKRGTPLMILIHGGAYMVGDKAGSDAGLWLNEGYAVASLNYRMLPKTGFPGQVEDCKAAVRWLRKHASEYGYDTRRVGAFGESAGGYFVAMLAATSETKQFDVGENLGTSSAIQVAIDWFGVSDLSQMDAQRLPNGMTHGQASSPGSMFLGKAIAEAPEEARRASPVHFLSKSTCPIYLAHGDADVVVPYGQSKELYEALKKLNIRTDFLTVKDGGHMFGDAAAVKGSVQFANAILHPNKKR